MEWAGTVFSADLMKGKPKKRCCVNCGNGIESHYAYVGSRQFVPLSTLWKDITPYCHPHK